MICIRRSEKPNYLKKSNNQFVEADYLHNTVRSELKKMQFYKCCYCERDLKDMTETEIEGEHYISRSSKMHKSSNNKIQWHLVNDWNNLLLACRTCNSKKGAKPPFDDNGNLLIINPACSKIDPENEIKFNLDIDPIPSYDLKRSSALGKSTIEKIGLYENIFLRGEFRRIKTTINACFDSLVTAFEREDDIEINNICRQISDITQASFKYAAFVRAVTSKRLAIFHGEEMPILEKFYNKTFNCPEIKICKGYQTNQ